MNRNTGNKYTKTVEWHFFREKEIRQVVMEARLDSASTGNVPGKTISSPTENAAIRNVTPLSKVVLPDGSEVIQPEKWLVVIEKAYEGLTRKQKKIAKKRYRQKEGYTKTCLALNISQNVYFNTLIAIRNYAVIVAVQAGLVRVY